MIPSANPNRKEELRLIERMLFSLGAQNANEMNVATPSTQTITDLGG